MTGHRSFNCEIHLEVVTLVIVGVRSTVER